MAEFTLKAHRGPQVFTCPDTGGVVMFKGQQLAIFGRYYNGTPRDRQLIANAETLPEVARNWWRSRNNQLSVWGHRANGVEP